MPHLTVYALEDQVTGREEALVAALIDTVASVYGEWAREIASVQIMAVPTGRWAVGGVAGDDIAPSVRFGVRGIALEHPDWPALLRRLVAETTDAVAGIIGDHHRAAITVEVVPTPDDLSAVGGVLLCDGA